MIAGIIVGSVETKREEIGVSQIFQNNNNKPVSEIAKYHVNGFVSPVCAMKFTDSQVSVVDLATMSKAAYESNATAALNFIRHNANLDKWELGAYNFRSDDTIGETEPPFSNYNTTMNVRFVEFVHSRTNISIIAVQGAS